MEESLETVYRKVSEALIDHRFDNALSMLSQLNLKDALRITLACHSRVDTVVSELELCEFAEFLGVYDE